MMNPFRARATKEAFSAVVERELPVLYRVGKRLARHEADAEDLVGQTMLKAHQLWPEFDGRHSRSWLIKIMRNEWLNESRRKSRSDVALEGVADPADDDFWKPIDSRLDSETILNAIDELPDDYRLAITLCDVEEWDYNETALALEIPLPTLRTRLFRGRKILRSRLVHLATQP